VEVERWVSMCREGLSLDRGRGNASRRDKGAGVPPVQSIKQP
jgi:hypothetical protein